MTTNRTIAVGVAQLAAGAAEPVAAVERVLQATHDALAAGAELVVLPELATPGYTSDHDLLARAAEGLDGPTVSGWQEAVAGTGKVIVGGFCERVDDCLFNSVAVVSSGGVIGHYRKLHLFGPERDVFAAGNLGLPVVDTPVGRIGVCVCYDLRFVEVVRILALRGAEIVAVPTAWVPGFDAVRWDADGWAPQARSAAVLANLNQVEIACASVGGTCDGLELLGSSVIIGPRGDVHAGPLRPDGADFAMALVDLGDIDVASDRGGVARPRADRRTDVYRLLIGDERL